MWGQCHPLEAWGPVGGVLLPEVEESLRIVNSAKPGILGWDPGAPGRWFWNLKMTKPSVARILEPQNHSILGLAAGSAKSWNCSHRTAVAWIREQEPAGSRVPQRPSLWLLYLPPVLPIHWVGAHQLPGRFGNFVHVLCCTRPLDFSRPLWAHMERGLEVGIR